MKLLSLLGFLFTFLLFSCSSSNQESSESDTSIVNSNIEKNEVTSNENLEEFEYKLPQSEYYYKIKIEKIYVDTIKNSFEAKKDQYEVPEKIDGYLLKVKFSMTNPYDKKMMAPVPDYFFLASEDKQAVSLSTTYSRDCHCEIDNSSEITMSNGKKLYEVSDGKCGYDDYCLMYDPKETKSFIIKFTDPFFTYNKQIIFWGFDRKWNNPDYTVGQDNGLIIDLVKKKITADFKF